MQPKPTDPAGSIWSSVTQDIQRGTLHALEQHARNGTSVVVWRDGKIVELVGEALERDIARLRAELG